MQNQAFAAAPERWYRALSATIAHILHTTASRNLLKNPQPRRNKPEHKGKDTDMGRSESKKVANQGMAQSSQDHANAQSALASANKLAKHSSTLGTFMNFGRKTYVAGGEFMKDQNTLANPTAAAGTSGVAGNLALNALRMGENTSGYANTVAESARQSSRDLTDHLAGADADRLSRLTAIPQKCKLGCTDGHWWSRESALNRSRRREDPQFLGFILARNRWSRR